MDQRQALIDRARAVAAELGRSSLTQSEFCRRAGINNSRVYRHFDGWGDLCRAAGLTPAHPLRRLDDDALFGAVRDAFLAAGGVCSLTRFDRHFRYTVSLFGHRGMGWDATKRAFRRWAEANAPDFPYMDQLPGAEGAGAALRDGPQWSTGNLPGANGGESALRDGPQRPIGDLLRANGKGNKTPFVLRSAAERCVSKDEEPSPGARSGGESAPHPDRQCGLAEPATPLRGVLADPPQGGRESRPDHRNDPAQTPFVLRSDAERRVSKDEAPAPAGRPVRARRPRALGDAIGFRAMQHAPVNEHGVILLFGMVAADLGFMVETVAAGFPDCEAKRRVAPGRWVRARIEFEYLSRNFMAHGHDPAGCDLIVCWRHNWPGCPLDVLELESAVAALAG